MVKVGLPRWSLSILLSVTLGLLLSVWFIFAIPPIASNIVLSSTYGLNTSFENLTVSWEASDVDGDRIRNITNWYQDGTSIMALNLPMEGGSNSTWTKDYSDLGNNGSVFGATWGNTSGYDGFGAYVFDGVDDCITVPDAAELEPASFSLEVWFKPLSLPPDFIKIVSKRGLDSSGYQIYLDSDGSIIFSVDTGGGNGVTSVSTVNLGNWYHTVGVYNGSDLTLYVNGVSQGSGPLTGSVASLMDVYIGSNNPAEAVFPIWDTYFNGTIDDVRFYNRSLTSEQVRALFQNRTDMIVSKETRVGEVWQAAVTPNDGSGDGAKVLSNNLTILNNSLSITECTSINSSGVYTLSSNIIDSAIPNGTASWNPNVCINITASNVVFDGAGYTIDGVDNTWTVGVYAYNPSNIITNITVKNLNVSDWWTGIFYREVTNSLGSISSIVGSSNTVGIRLEDSSKVLIQNNNISNNSDGISFRVSPDNVISANYILNNSARGIYMDFCGECGRDNINNTIKGNNISNNGEIGVYFDGATSNLVYNNYIAANILRNAVDNPSFGLNYWNTSQMAGTNIIGGSVIGGNFWGDYLGSDTDEDGFGDTLLPYTSQGNITIGGDYLPLTGDTLPPKINITKPVNGSVVNIFNDWFIGNVSDSLSNVTEVNISLNGAYLGLYPINQSTGLFSAKMNYSPGVLNNISISADDSAGNTANAVISVTVRANSDSKTINATAGEVVVVNETLNNTDLTLEIVTNSNLTFQVNVTAVGNASFLGASPLENSSAYGLFDANESAIGKFVEIIVSDNINSSSANLSSAVIKLYVKSEDLDLDGDGVYNGTGDFNISSLKIYWYNSSNTTWHPLVKGADYETLGPFVFDSGVNETPAGVYLGFAFANISHFSVYGVSASVYGGGAVVAGGGADIAGNPHSDGSIPLLIGLQTAKSKLINLIVSDVNYLGLVRQFNYFWYEFADSPQALRGPLSVLGIHWAPMKYANNLNQILHPHSLKEMKGDIYSIAAQRAKSKYGSGSPRALVTRGDLGVDSLAASSYAKILNIPILLTEPEALPEVTAQALSDLGADSVVVAGGPEAVSSGVESVLPVAERIGGADRYETAVLFAEALQEETPSDVVIITDGLSPEATSLMVAYYYNAPIIYVRGDRVPEATEAFLSHNKFKIVVTIGVSTVAGERLNELVG